MRRVLALLLLCAPLALFALACGGGNDEPRVPTRGPTVEASRTPTIMTLTSASFEAGDTIPLKYTCWDGNVSPQLSWSEPPEGTQALAIFVDDFQGPVGILNMWNVYNLPPDLRSMEEGQPAGEELKGGRQGPNNLRGRAYFGPCPTPGSEPKEIVYSVWALNTKVTPLGEEFSDRVKFAMENHLLAKGELRVFAYRDPETPTPEPTGPTPEPTRESDPG